MSVVSEAYVILFLFFAHVGSIDLLIDKQKLIKNKVLKANALCGSGIMDVSVRRQLKGKIFGFRINKSTISRIRDSAVPCFELVGLLHE